MESVYNPQTVEERIYKFWEEKGYFHGKVDAQHKPFAVVIPPPNVTGILHMGHVMDETPQDIMTRFRRMQGYNTVWIPGTDHAGIATQNAVEKSLRKENLSRHKIGREKFVEMVWKWKEQYGNTIIQQLKRLGCSCDWSRLRFTMDEDYSKAVMEVFIRLYKKGLIYQGDYIINWCPRCQTALSDEEVEHRDIEGGLYWIKYPMKDKNADVTQIMVATTRPETMLGDTAVAVHPDDKRYKDLIGKTVILPLVNREIPIIADSFTNPEFGSGAVKVTPAHDPNDFAMGQRHNLAFIKVIGPDGKMNENAGAYKGLDRFEARKKVIADLEAQGLYDKKDKHMHAVGHCYRCETMIEPYLSLQWFVRMKPLAEPAIQAVKDGRVKFFPERWDKVYMEWMTNIRDWCISRQLWWGHRIPIWYCGAKRRPDDHRDKTSEQCPPIASKDKPAKCPKCGNTELTQDPDVLDTWFSSWLWPFAVFGWPKETAELKYFYPTAWLNSGKDILFFWVSRMIMAGIEFGGDVPFRHVYIHGIARDDKGRKLSKSLGNSPDPIDLMTKYSADALRFGIMTNIPLGGDINLSEEVYVSGRNFCNKLWNASRLILTNLPTSEEVTMSNEQCSLLPANCSLSFEDKWILSRLNSTIADYTKALESYEFSQAAHSVYHFFWGDVCDWYLEMIKPRLYSKEPGGDKALKSNLLHLFNTILRLLHPLIPHITEELWQNFREKGGWSESVMIAPWPESDSKLIYKEAEDEMKLVMEIIRAVRDIRNKMDIDKKQALSIIVSTADKGTTGIIETHRKMIEHIANISSTDIKVKAKKPDHSATEVISEGKYKVEVFVPLEGIINLDAEKKRLQNKLAKAEEQLTRSKQQLSNREFRKNAPPEILAKEEAKNAALAEQFGKLKKSLDDLR
ncbi:MAG: valine--tRNA ligase [Planctomycetes bacterium]|nr:valine--tRNA ligase [Planctomycetota bacterium]